MALLEVNKVDFKYYGSNFGVQGVDLTLSKGERAVIYGRENCGKTTLLRVLCGLEKYNSGSIKLEGSELKELSQKQMDIGFSFDRRVLENKALAKDVISYPMKLRQIPPDDIDSYLEKVSRNCNIPLLVQVRCLSDIQVAMLILARLFAVDRRLYLVDDVWKDLPPEKKDTVAAYLIENIKGKSAIVATDDSFLARDISTDKVAVMTDKQILTMLSVDEITRRPLNMQSAILVGYELHIGELVKSDRGYFALLYGKHYPVSRPIGDIYVGKRVCFALKSISGEVMSFYYDIDVERIISV